MPPKHLSISSHELSNLRIYSAKESDNLAASLQNVKEGNYIQHMEEQQLQGSIPTHLFAANIILSHKNVTIY